MEQNWISKWSVYFVRNRHRRVLHKFVQIMACIVVFCTTYALILPAITMEKKAFCGLEEHTHSEVCYQQTVQKKLICTPDVLGLHVHEAGCYDAEHRVVCGQADYVVHSHDASCFEGEGNLVCTLAEQSAHVHGDSCYAAPEEVLHRHTENCYTRQKGDLICTIEEYAGHSHSADCYAPGEELECTLEEHHVHGNDCYTYPLVCTLSTDPHAHDGSCYTIGDLQCSIPEGHIHEESCMESRHTCIGTEEDHVCGSECYTTVSVCSIPENHSHGDSCYAAALSCGREEGHAHEHGDGCFGTEPELICSLTENHSHQDDCYKKVLTCEIPEDPGHSHTDECYLWETVTVCGYEEGEPEQLQPVLICTEPTPQTHIHTDACFETTAVEPVPICGNSADEHTHTPSCYTVICGQEEHTHSLACYSDPEADVESRETWEATFSQVELSGDRYLDVIAIAESQLGYVESSRNYAVWEDNSIHGYTRYGAWYGVPYGDWCGMFVSFCLRYAGVDNIPINYGVRPWIEDLTELGLYHSAEEYTPKSGDIVFFDWEGDGLSDHVGLVYEILEATDTEPAKLKTIEGNASNCVQYVTYELNDPVLLGYSILPEKEEAESPVYYCGMDEHIHQSDACFADDGNLLCILTEHTHSDDCTRKPVEYFCGREVHTHSDACYDADGNLICTLEEHVHTDECAQLPAEYYCGLESHAHDTQCYDPETGVLTCKLPEHTHSDDCTRKPVEYFCGREVHTHSDACYDADGKLICTLEEHVHDEACTRKPAEYLCGITAHTHAEACYDAEGNLICELTEHIHTTLCLGFTCGMKEHSHDETCYNEEDNLICTLTVHLHDSNCDNYVCGQIPHTHTESCYDSTASLICGMAEHIHTVDCMEFKVSFNDAAIQVSVSITGIDSLPEDLTLNVQPVTEENNPAVFGSMQVALSQQMSNHTQYIGNSRIFDMELLSGGVTYALPETAMVNVSASFAEPVFTPEEVSDSVGMYAFTLTNDDSAAPDAEIPSVPDAMPEILDISMMAQNTVMGSASAPAVMALAGEEPSGNEGTAMDQLPSEAGPAEAGNYLASVAENETIQNTNIGVTGVSFRSSRISAFAVALASEIQEGTFWTRVMSTDYLTSDGTYMIVSAEGNYAAQQNGNTTYSVPVTIQTVKGNTGYYTISDNGRANLRWTITKSGNGYRFKNIGSNSYLTNNNYNTFTLSHVDRENCWRIYYTVVEAQWWWETSTNYYLTNSGDSTAFSFSSTSSEYTRGILIFKLSDKTELEVPRDVTTSSQPSSTVDPPDKPSYGAFLPTTGSLTGETAVSDAENVQSNVKGYYYSDPATSDIETQFRKDSYDAHTANDGKVLTDKSVIYGKDDYGAFNSYEPNTFGVTLSALGQEYALPQEDIVATPVDVVFVLDCSSSMTSNEVGNVTRVENMITALNQSMTHIFNTHEENRVGVVTFSRGASEVLPLDRYTADTYKVNGKDVKQFFVPKDNSSITNGHGSSHDITRVQGSTSLKTESGSSYANAGSGSIQGYGTYTQAGIAMGYNVFSNNKDTTYTQTIGEGENERTYTVNRQPVIILLSDGEPTYSTNIFMDVLNGPHYGDGDGVGGNGNDKGIHGYYTILSANYYKRMIGIHYQRPALFYTVGMGIYPDQDGPMYNSTAAGDNYRRAVLNPTVSAISGLSSNINTSNTTEMLKSLMHSSFANQAVSVRAEWPETSLGIPHRMVPALQGNPYSSNYSYADDAFFGDLTSDDLTEIFDKILATSFRATSYGFVLYRNSSVTLTDNIGEGMEIKGTPVLRYGGTNYTNPTVSVNGNVTTYTYSKEFTDPYIPNRVIDLSRITVKVTTDENGNQTVEMYVPDTALPTYTPELLGSEFYYESLPVRLIYQVGLTGESEQQVLALQQTGGEKVFYTNRYVNESEVAISTLIPSDANPFYFDVDNDGTVPPYQPHHTDKAENTTGTREYVVDCSKRTETYNGASVTKVIHKLGNNGKLVFSIDALDIPVEKAWQDTYVGQELPEISLTLYRITPDSENTQLIRQVEAVKSIVLNSNSGTPWTGVFADVPFPSENCYYVIAENSVPEGFRVRYSGETVSISPDNGRPITAVKVNFTNQTALMTTITNVAQWYELPETGGAGTIPYTAGGLLLTATALLLLYNNMIKRRKEDLISS